MARKKSTGKTKKRTSMFLSSEALKASAKKAEKLGISRGMYLEQLVRVDTGLGVGVELNDKPELSAVAPATQSVFA